MRNHRLLVGAAFIIVVLAGLPLAWHKGEPRYSATAVVFVSPRFLANLQDSKEHELESNSQYREYVQQNVKTINRFDIVVEALRKAGPGSSSWIKPRESVAHAAERLQAALDIRPVPDTYQIAVTLEASERAGVAELVNAVVNTYLARARAEEFYAGDERITNLLEDRARLEQMVGEMVAQRLAIAQTLGVSSFTDNLINPYDHLLTEARQALAVAHRQDIESHAQLAAYDDKERRGGEDSLRAMAADEASRDTALTSLESNQSIRRTQLLTTISGLSPDHPGRRAAERELSELDKQSQQVARQLSDNYSRNLLDRKKADAYKTALVEQKLQAEVEKQAAQAMFFAKNYQDGIQLGVLIEQTRKRIGNLQERIDFLSLEKNAPGFVRMFSRARTPETPSKSSRRKLMAAVAFAAIFAGLLLPAGIDVLDPRIHTPRDAEKMLGFSPVAWLMEKAGAGPDFGQEQILRLASRIVQDNETNGSRIFAFTAVKARGGTSSIVMETAGALSRLGVSALAIEANAYRADPRYRSPDSRGLSFVLTGNHDIASAVVPGDGEMSDYVPLGDVSAQNLPDIQSLIGILRASADSYSIVLIDLPPVLVSVDAEFIARGADVSVMVIEAQAVTKWELQRATVCLERIGVRAVSAVLNRVRLDAGDGFARRAREEFRTGASPNGPSLFGKWFWK